MSHDEAIGLLVALACAFGCAFFLLCLPSPAFAEDVGATSGAEAEELAEGLTDALAETIGVEPVPAPSNPMPLIVVVVIMGVALAIAFVVSRRHAKPQKLGGAKGDVW